MAAMTMTIEQVRAFNGLDVLVAKDEGLFAAEGLDLRIVPVSPGDTASGTLTKPVTGQGRLVDRGEAVMFQGRAGGNNRRVADSAVGALQVGRRSMIVCGALVVAPDSDVFTPQELAHRPVALDYGNGTAYAGLLMLEGAMPRAAVTTRAATVNSGERLAALLRGEFAATVLQEPWITLAERSGCRLVSTTFFHGTWVADASVSAEAYAAFLRAITRAVRRINADKRRYVDYFIRDFP